MHVISCHTLGTSCIKKVCTDFCLRITVGFFWGVGLEFVVTKVKVCYNRFHIVGYRLVMVYWWWSLYYIPFHYPIKNRGITRATVLTPLDAWNSFNNVTFVSVFHEARLRFGIILHLHQYYHVTLKNLFKSLRCWGTSILYLPVSAPNI